jgi:hypothetical protein
VSLSDELKAEVISRKPKSQIEVFLDSLNKKDRDDFDAWLAGGAKDARAMYRVLKRRGLPVADATFRNWVLAQCR